MSQEDFFPLLFLKFHWLQHKLHKNVCFNDSFFVLFHCNFLLFYLTFIWTVSPIEINDLIYDILYKFALDKNTKMD